MKNVSFSLGLTVFSIGLSTVLGYVLGIVGMYTWNFGIGMALNTGVALTLAGAAIAILSSRSSWYYERDKSE